MKVKSEREVAQSCLTLSDPMDCSLPGFSVHGVFQARVLEWGAIVFSASNAKKTVSCNLTNYADKFYIIIQCLYCQDKVFKNMNLI